jgi:prepilin-type N-terminal cleavage/methylation domain-containing protein
MSKKAFSLIELSIVLVIIGLLVAGITQGSRLVQKFRISTAQTLTQSSPVNGIKNLVAWYETTSQASFDSAIDNGVAISTWYDISPSVNKINATQTTAANRPIYTENDINSLPTLKFTRSQSQVMNLPNGTIPYNNSPYTIFIVAKADASCKDGQCGLLGSGLNSPNQGNYFMYAQDQGFLNHWFTQDAEARITSNTTTPHFVMFYYNQSLRRILYNGLQLGIIGAGSTYTNNQASPLSNAIGRSQVGQFLYGSIGEIIIFNRALMIEEIDSIESYLGKKWGIKVIN